MITIAITLVISLISLTNLMAQKDNDFKTVKDSIARYSLLLTGKWQLIGYFYKNKYIETELSSSIGDSITEIKLLTDSCAINKTFRNDSLISISKIKEIDLIEMGFKKDGKGYYQHYPDYNPGANWQTVVTCQPVPRIKHDHGHYILHFTSLAGEYESEFKLQGDSLIIKRSNELEEKYIRFKK